VGIMSHAVGQVSSFQVDVTAAPEPSTMVLLASGLMGLLAYVWQKRR
jgi:hypothetical protein